MKRNKIKLLIIALFVLPLIAFVMFSKKPTGVLTSVNADDTAAVYKAKCQVCHSPKAEKHFNLELTDEHHVQVILKGKKAEKPPNMPEFETKGINEEQAKALVIFMRGLRNPAN